MDAPTIIAISSFIVMLVLQVFSAGIFIGGLIFSLKYIEKQIGRLEEKQDKHNNLIERMAVVEQSTASSHHRTDELKDIVDKIYCHLVGQN